MVTRFLFLWKKWDVHALVFLLALLGTMLAPPAAFAENEAVSEGQSALKSGRYKWYDDTTDDVSVVGPKLKPNSTTGSGTRSSSSRSRGSSSSSSSGNWGNNWGGGSGGGRSSSTGGGAGLNMGSGWAYLLFILAGAALAGFLYILFKHHRHQQPDDDPFELTNTGPTQHVDRLEALPTRLRPKSDFSSEAERLAHQGDYQQAMIYLYSQILLALDKASVIRLARGKTNHQYSREVRRNARGLGPAFEDCVAVFQEAFFGKKQISKTQFDQVWNQRHALLNYQGLVE